MNPDRSRLVSEHLSQVDVPRPFACGLEAAAFHDFPAYLVAVAADPHAGMHQEPVRLCAVGDHGLDAPGHNPSRGSPPSRVEEGDDSCLRIEEIYRNAVRDRDRDNLRTAAHRFLTEIAGVRSVVEPAEVEAQLRACGLDGLVVSTVSDRHLLVTGHLPAQ